jgi:hypothetical protein
MISLFQYGQQFPGLAPILAPLPPPFPKPLRQNGTIIDEDTNDEDREAEVKIGKIALGSPSAMFGKTRPTVVYVPSVTSHQHIKLHLH